eukprot:6186352-Pleurochrysis_carterae.AAC.1
MRAEPRAESECVETSTELSGDAALASESSSSIWKQSLSSSRDCERARRACGETGADRARAVGGVGSGGTSTAALESSCWKQPLEEVVSSVPSESGKSGEEC